VYKFLKSLFSENSDVSSVRVMSMVSLLIAGYIGVYGLTTKADLDGLAMLCGVFLTAAFGGKVGQKFVETKTPPKTIKDAD
jgi:uncharacterized membrane protein YfcA